jgi:TldD protein
MQDLLDRALNLAHTRGAQYADARVIEKETETLVLQNGEMRTLESAKNLGVGVRVLVDGAWGFASSRDLSLSEIDPFTISLDQKASVLVETDQVLASVPEIKARTSNLVFIKERKWFANSDGARTDQTIIETGGGMTAYAVGEGEV